MNPSFPCSAVCPAMIISQYSSTSKAVRTLSRSGTAAATVHAFGSATANERSPFLQMRNIWFRPSTVASLDLSAIIRRAFTVNFSLGYSSSRAFITTYFWKATSYRYGRMPDATVPFLLRNSADGSHDFAFTSIKVISLPFFSRISALTNRLPLRNAASAILMFSFSKSSLVLSTASSYSSTSISAAPWIP